MFDKLYFLQLGSSKGGCGTELREAIGAFPGLSNRTASRASDWMVEWKSDDVRRNK